VVERNIAISLPSTGDDEWNAVREPLLSGWLTQGPKVAEFEKKFASYHEANHALATTSCTTGLHLILAALGIGPGDEVIVPQRMWCSIAVQLQYLQTLILTHSISTQQILPIESRLALKPLWSFTYSVCVPIWMQFAR
jgi:cystathionine beta-lyase/cystathionine gamma-synthase